MAGLLRAVVVSVTLAGSPALAQQQIDPNFQALLTALMHGAPAALLTPLPDGSVEVTSFTAPGQRTAADAALLIQRAQITLQNFGVERPTGQQLATALAGGVINVPTGSTQVPGVLPQGTPGVAVSSQVVNAASMPTVVGASPSGVASPAAPPASAGGTRPPAAAQQPLITPLPPTPFSQPR